MNNNLSSDTSLLVRSAVIAAIYAVFTVLVPIPQYGPIQFRFAEIMVLLVFYNKKYIPGLVLGCAMANFFSPMAWFDVIFGTLSSYVAFRLMVRRKNLFVASLFPVLLVSIPALGFYFIMDNSGGFLATLISFMASEFIMVSIIGVAIFKVLERNTGFMKYIKEF